MTNTSRSLRRTIYAAVFLALLTLAGISAGTRYAQADGAENVFLPIIYGAPSTIPSPGQ